MVFDQALHRCYTVRDRLDLATLELEMSTLKQLEDARGVLLD
jgi:hypothetical protein